MIIKKARNSFRQLFRLIFVIFFLYLLGDAFYRWDGFNLHSTFIEFIPSVALAAILWSIVALFTSLLVWLLLSSIEWVCHRMGLKITIEHLLVYLSILIILGGLGWKGKKLLWPLILTSQQTKLIVLICVSLLSVFLTWLLRDRAEKWVGIIHERITPLVWFFGMIVLVSIPVVTYHTWFKDTDKVITKEVTRPSVSDKKRPNIILVTFDALAAGDMSTYGYHRPTTPFITKWAKEATLFTNLEAASNWTVPTTASLMTGKRPWTHMAAHLQGAAPLKSNIESLPLLLKQNGYFNMAFVTNTLSSVKALGIAGIFDIAPLPAEFSTPHSLVGDGLNVTGIIDKLLSRLFADKIALHDWILKEDFKFGKLLNVISRNISTTTTPPEIVFNRFLDVLNNNPPEPFFAWIHIFPPHDPYLPPQAFRGIFSPSSEFRTYKSQNAVRLESHKYLFQFQPYPREMQPSMDILRSHYDEFIRYCDKEFENFIKQLTAKNKLRDPVIILSSDHGESFENGYHTHGGPFLYESVTHIPFIIKEPNQNKGQIIHELAEQVDIPATILDIAGIPKPSWMEGRSLLPLMKGRALPPKPAFSMNLRMKPKSNHKIPDGSYAIWEGDYKLIHILEDKRKWSLLFNLKKDPDELNNIFEKEPETGQRLLDLIYDNLKKANERIRSGMVITSDSEKK
ncbi:arylsulfatase [bacterium BMS3Abin15]|nr:arylsulfatase [bacterium BMS3Abin15]